MSNVVDKKADSTSTAKPNEEVKKSAWELSNETLINQWLSDWMKETKGRSGKKLSETQRTGHIKTLEKVSSEFGKSFKAVSVAEVNSYLLKTQNDPELAATPKLWRTGECVRIFTWLGILKEDWVNPLKSKAKKTPKNTEPQKASKSPVVAPGITVMRNMNEPTVEPMTEEVKASLVKNGRNEGESKAKSSFVRERHSKKN